MRYLTSLGSSIDTTEVNAQEDREARGRAAPIDQPRRRSQLNFGDYQEPRVVDSRVQVTVSVQLGSALQWYMRHRALHGSRQVYQPERGDKKMLWSS